jgi:hypothetical protein
MTMFSSESTPRKQPRRSAGRNTSEWTVPNCSARPCTGTSFVSLMRTTPRRGSIVRSTGEQSLSTIADWGPADDWSGWADAKG